MKKGKILLIIILVLILIPFIINGIVIFSTLNVIYSIEKISKKKDIYDIGMVLGCGIKNNQPSLMLKDRLDMAIKLKNDGKIKKILISGDHHEDYSEVNVMHDYLLNNGINEEDILDDYEGYSTRESINNYQNKYASESLIIITQKYHMYRAVYLAKKNNLKVAGVYAKRVRYKNQLIRDIREILARCKDFI